jgi:Ca2+-binding RTX toxin-like protein
MPAVTTIASSGNQNIDGLLLGVKWAVNSFTFSFPTDASFYGAGYSSNGETTSNFEALNATQQNYVRNFAFAQFAAVANLTFSEMTETSSSHADLRFAQTDATSTAWGYYPATQAYGGDTWYRNSGNNYDNPVIGNYAAHTFLHEIGHALGLVHGHDATNPFGALPANHDSVEYSIMTYRSYVGGPLNGYTYGSASAPQTLMQNDIAVLQYLYGANFNTNSGNTVYSWNSSTGQTFVNGVSMGAVAGNRIFMTVWDGNGTDTYDLSAYSTNLSINLQPGAWSTFDTSSTGQRASLGGGNLAAGNVANALLYNGNTQSLIENVIGGTGSDTIVGNVVSNNLQGGGGNDILNGLAGADVLTGGSGADTFRFDASAFDGSQDQIADYSYAANDVIDLSSVVSTSAANLASYVRVQMASGSTASLMVDRDGTGSTYGWVTIAQINGVSANSTVNLLIGPSSTAMTTQAVPANTTPAYTDTYYDTANQYGWASYSATYNSINQILSITFNYDDGTHSSTIYDTPNVEFFSDYLVTYSASWGVTRIIFNYDDGTHTVGSYDIADEYNFTDYLATFDSQWRLTRNIFVNDDGTNSVVYWDAANQYAWAWQVFDYDSNWNLTGTSGQNDDGSTFGNGYVGSGDDGSEGPASGEHGLDDLPAWVGAWESDENDDHLGPHDLPAWTGALEANGSNADELNVPVRIDLSLQAGNELKVQDVNEPTGSELSLPDGNEPRFPVGPQPTLDEFLLS